jgi:hypothetical protein
MVNLEQRERLIERHRYINVEHDQWWDCVYSDFKEDMREVGIHVNRIYFSGFWSQGDGACFEGGFCSSGVYLDHHHKDQYPMIRKLMDVGGYIGTDCKHSGHYYHEHCTSFSTDHDTFYRTVECPTEFHEQIVDSWDRQLEDEVEAFEKDVIEQWRTYMRDLYRKLEEEYDYQTSDEAVWDTIEANELDEDEEEYDEVA